MLVLFDIDGTLVDTAGAGRRAMESAGRELFGAGFTCEGIAFAGGLDPLIWSELCRRNGVADAAGERDAFRATYRRHLEAALEPGVARALPGVLALLAALEASRRWTLGVLSGNWPETGRMKLAASGIAPARFAVGAWGDDGARRADLVGVALERCVRDRGRRPPPDAVLVVGDTPADVACAREHGCRSLAVATGASSRGDLEAAGADLAVDDLGATEAILGWIA